MVKRGEYLIRRPDTNDVEFLNEIHNDESTYSKLINVKLSNVSQDKNLVLDDNFISNTFIGLYKNQAICRIRSVCLTGFKDTSEVGLDILYKERGKGHSKWFYKLLMHYLYSYENKRVVYLRVLSNNANAINVYTKLGFEECGRYPEYVIRNGRSLDYLVFFKKLGYEDIWDSNSSL